MYTKCYCEENTYMLCQRMLKVSSPFALSHRILLRLVYVMISRLRCG